jgi:hypothetical protein
VLPLVAFKVRGDKKKNWPTEGYGAEFHPQEVPRSRDQAMVIPDLCKEPEYMNGAYF